MKHEKLQRPMAGLLTAMMLFGLLTVGAAAAGPQVIADDPLNGSDPVNTTVSQQVTAESGVGVDVRSNNNPVTATITGGVQVEDHGAYGENAIGVRAVSAPGGRVDLTLNGATVRSDANIAYGVHLETSNSAFTSCYYERGGQTVPMMKCAYGAFPATVSKDGADVTSAYTVGSDTNPLVFFAKAGEDAWDLFLVGYDATVTGWSKAPVSEQTVRDFCGYVSGTWSTAQQPITVTVCTPGDDTGAELTLTQAGDGRYVLYDLLGNYFLDIYGADDAVRQPTRDNSGEFILYTKYSGTSLGAAVSGTVSAEAEKACAVTVKSSHGPIDAAFTDAEFVSRGKTWAWGINATTLKPTTINGSGVSITAAAEPGGEASSVLGLMVTNTSGTSQVELTGENSISVSSSTAPGPGAYSGGIVVYTGSTDPRNPLIMVQVGVTTVKYSGNITASDSGW